MCRRASGRRADNTLRQEEAALRRLAVLDLLVELDLFVYGTQAEIARRLGVSQATISRDIKAIFATDHVVCPRCRSVVKRSRVA